MVFFFIPCPSNRAIEADAFGACGMRYPQLLLPTDLTKTSNPKLEQTVLMCWIPHQTQR